MRISDWSSDVCSSDLACAKKPGAKKAHPAFAPGALRRVRGAGGIFRGGILPPRKTPHIHVRRPSGLIRRLRRYGGAPRVKVKVKVKVQVQCNSNCSPWERRKPRAFRVRGGAGPEARG